MMTHAAPAEGATVTTIPTSPAVEQFMHDDLKRSGLTAADMNAELFNDPFSQQPIGYRIPYFYPDGSPHPMYRVRLASPPPGGGKYTQPDKKAFPEGTYPYLPLHNTDPSLSGPALLVEGEKKTVAAIRFLKRIAYGIGGCWNWSQKDEQGLHHVHKEVLARFPQGSLVEIVFDGDLLENMDVQTAAGTLRRRLIEAGLVPVFVMLPRAPKGRAGLDDWLVAIHAAGLNPITEFEKLPRTSGVEFLESSIDVWDTLDLVMTDGGVPVNNESNIATVLTRHDWFESRLRFNSTMQRAEFTAPDGRYYENDEIIPQVVVWLQKRLAMTRVTSDKVSSAMAFLSAPGSPIHYNAVADRLRECARTWDGTPRVDQFFVRALHLPDTEYHRAVSRAFFMGAARRATTPGCKMDYVVVLAGKGGIGKTTFFQRIAMNPEWVKEVTEGLDRSKDARMALSRGWIVEASEGVALDLASAGGAKAIITDVCDEFRPPYGRSLQRFPRRTVLVASTNDETLLKYEAGSGNRRFLPITMRGRVNLALIDAEIAQVWGEAMRRVAAGEREWEGLQTGGPDLETLAADEVALHTESDPWVEDLSRFLTDPTHLHVRAYHGRRGLAVASYDLLTAALRLDPDKKLPTHGKRLRRAMQAIGGWEPVKSSDRHPTNGTIVTFTGYWKPD